MVEDENEVVEIEDDSDEKLEDDSDEKLEEDSDEIEIEEDESGIFDDLLEDVEETVSDFSIGDTILSVGEGEQSWSKEDLEEVIRNERIEKDWQDSEEFIGGDFYNAANGADFYGADNERREGFYEDKLRGDDLYKEGNGGDLYNTGGEGVYAGKTNEEGVYDVSKRGMKSYDEVIDNRRSGRSMLEVAGFEDKEKQKHRDTHRLMDYNAKKAA
jgi:hypothetical protein